MVKVNADEAIAAILAPLIGELGMTARMLAAVVNVMEQRSELITKEYDDSGYYAVPADAFDAMKAALVDYYRCYNRIIVEGAKMKPSNDNHK